jgi:hypothetical protein
MQEAGWGRPGPKRPGRMDVAAAEEGADRPEPLPDFTRVGHRLARISLEPRGTVTGCGRQSVTDPPAPGIRQELSLLNSREPSARRCLSESGRARDAVPG